METGRPTWSSRAWLTASALLGLLLLVLLAVGGEGPGVVVPLLVIAALAVLVSAWAVLRTRRQRREYEDRLATWAGERAAQAERLRIAGDLHDLVSHGLGVITVRAAVAARTANRDDAERAAALADIERVGRETTTELRRMLTVLHTPAAGVAAPLRPAETLRDLPAIVEATRRTGLRPELDLPGLDEVSPGAQLTVCAVVREALANAARHAGPTRVRVSVRRDAGTLVATVGDDGPVQGWEARPGAGHGLAGLRARVAALGGTLHAGPAAPGFTVTARIPDRAGA